MSRRNQNGNRTCFAGQIHVCFGQTEQELCAGPATAKQFLGVGGIDTDGVAVRAQGADGVFKVRKRRIRQTTEIDDVGAGGPHRRRPRQDRLDAKRGCVDNLGEDTHILSR